MSKCCNVWTPVFQCYESWTPEFQDYSPMNLDFNSEIKPVISKDVDYESILNKPSINGVTLVGNKTNEEILIQPLSNEDIESLLARFRR